MNNPNSGLLNGLQYPLRGSLTYRLAARLDALEPVVKRMLENEAKLIADSVAMAARLAFEPCDGCGSPSGRHIPQRVEVRASEIITFPPRLVLCFDCMIERAQAAIDQAANASYVEGRLDDQRQQIGRAREVLFQRSFLQRLRWLFAGR